MESNEDSDMEMGFKLNSTLGVCLTKLSMKFAYFQNQVRTLIL